MSFDQDKKAPVFVAGHRGMVGSAVVRSLKARGHTELLLRTRQELDLTVQSQVSEFFSRFRPKYVFLCAAKVGGIYANQTGQPEFLLDNLKIQNHVIDSALQFQSEKLLFLGSSCIYPKQSPQPIPEEALLTGPLEPTNEGYALAKIAGLKLCEYLSRDRGKRFISAMPTNLYGPGDNYDPLKSHVIPALLRKFFEAIQVRAPRVTVWGSGKPKREFLHVDDLAQALLLLMDRYEAPGTINVGSGEEVSIAELAELIREASGFEGELTFDPAYPDGTPRKFLDISKISGLGWKPKISLRQGLTETWSAVQSEFGKSLKNSRT